MNSDRRMIAELDFECLVNQYYPKLYKFALSLTHREDEASDLTQQTFYVWAAKGHQLRDASKVKTWLFTTLHREFLQKRRRETRFQHQELSEVNGELPNIAPEVVNEADWATLLHSLARLDEAFQAPLALFYLEDYSYKEIAEIVGIPLGTVKSRISRGIAQLKHSLLSESLTPKKSKPAHHGQRAS